MLKRLYNFRSCSLTQIWNHRPPPERTPTGFQLGSLYLLRIRASIFSRTRCLIGSANSENFLIVSRFSWRSLTRRNSLSTGIKGRYASFLVPVLYLSKNFLIAHILYSPRHISNSRGYSKPAGKSQKGIRHILSKYYRSLIFFVALGACWGNCLPTRCHVAKCGWIGKDNLIPLILG
jgi:hypothetical protein